MRAVFPGTPVHASAAQALRRRPPPDAHPLELFRDGILRLLSKKLFLYLAVTWLTSLIITIIFVAVVYIAIFVPAMAGMGEVCEDRACQTLCVPPYKRLSLFSRVRSISLPLSLLL